MDRLRNSPLFIALFICAIAIPQVYAIYSQVREGFLPLKSPPSRVAFSWDMFANPVERCTIEWSPAIKPLDKSIASLRDIEIPFEFDIIFDQVGDYDYMAHELCRVGTTGITTVHQHCFFQNGTQTDSHYVCP